MAEEVVSAWRLRCVHPDARVVLPCSSALGHAVFRNHQGWSMRTDVLAQALLSVTQRQALFLALLLENRKTFGAHVGKEGTRSGKCNKPRVCTIQHCAGAACGASRLGAVLMAALLTDLHIGRGRGCNICNQPTTVCWWRC
jgi:hypothetical protein